MTARALFKPLVATAMIILPLLVAATIKLWPSRDAAKVSEATSVVVLPARVFGAGNLSYLADAVPAALSGHLARVEGLETKAPPTSIEVERAGGDYNKIADAYGVNMLVLTAITVDSGAFQLNLQVIDPRTRRVLWRNPYQGPGTRYLELIRAAGEGLRNALRPASAPVRALSGKSSISQAELAFREGEHYRERYNHRHEIGDFDMAFAAFRRALEIDSGLADAAAGIARLYGMRVEAAGPAPELLAEVDSWATRALTIDPGCGQAFNALSHAENWKADGSRTKRLSYALRAATLGPDNVSAHLGVGNALSSVVLSLAATQQSRRLDPLNLDAPIAEARYLQQTGRSDEALEVLDRNVLKIRPDMGQGLWAKAMLLLDLGRTAEAKTIILEIDRQVLAGKVSPLRATMIHYQLALAANDRKTAKQLFDELLANLEGPLGPEIVNAVVPVLAKHGPADAAFQFLRRAIQAGVLPAYDWLMLDPRLQPLRKEARFSEILRPARKRFTEMIQALEEAQQRQQLPKYIEPPLANVKLMPGV